jgi:purine nucleosidase
MATKVLLDTDIDIVGDIDDLMCLAYLLAHPACDLLGITTVSWDTTHRARVASALCKAAERQVPIFPGAETPLLVPLPDVTPRREEGVEEAILRQWAHDHAFPRGQAVEFMRHTIRSQPGDVVLLAIGPLTNVALLFAVDPEIPQLLRGLVLMAGAFTHQAVGEWNARVDPHATALVYRATVGLHRSIGLDVTEHVQLDAPTIRQRLRGCRLAALHAMTEAWFQAVPIITFHDPLAAATIFEPQICRFAHGTVAVELTHEAQLGVTHWTPDGANPRHEVAIDADAARFFDHYFAIVG